jgi:hypothetical protein
MGPESRPVEVVPEQGSLVSKGIYASASIKPYKQSCKSTQADLITWKSSQVNCDQMECKLKTCVDRLATPFNWPGLTGKCVVQIALELMIKLCLKIAEYLVYFLSCSTLLIKTTKCKVI